MISRSKHRLFLLLAMVGICIGASSFQYSLRLWREPACSDHLHVQPLSSEAMQQTLPIIDLRNEPITSLYYLHIQPPAFDAIRAVLARLSPDEDEAALALNVDRDLYHFYTCLFGLMAALIYFWMQQMTSPAIALIASCALILHPAMVFYSTFLDATFLSSAAILFYFVTLWNCVTTRRYSHALAACVLLLFFTRSNFQWPFIVVTLLSLLIAGIPKSGIRDFLLGTAPVVTVFLAKQYLLFGLTLTTSFSGLSAGHTVQLFPAYDASPRLNETQYDRLDLPTVLKRRRKGNGAVNFNHISYLAYNTELLASAAVKLSQDGLRIQLDRYRENIGLYFLPSSKYSVHAIVDVLPWRDWYDFIVSESRLTMLLLFAIFIWLALSRGQERKAGWAMAVPAFFLFATCILCDRGENLRFKWLLEPVLMVFMATQFHAFWVRCRPRETAPEA